MTLAGKFNILYSWLIRTSTYFLPDVSVFQRFRGFLYSFGMKRCGKRFRVSYNVVLNRLELLEIGDNVYFACNTVIAGGGTVSIGSNVLVGPNVNISAANHRFDGVNFLSGYEFGSVRIDDNCWIGGNVSLLMGTHIPESSVVAAGAVCNRSFAQTKSLIGGVPARVIKKLTNTNPSI